MEDFSLVVAIHTPDDLNARPAYCARLDPKSSVLAEVLAEYRFKHDYPCGLSNCRQAHQTGYLVVTTDGIETNVGNVCGKKIFGDNFSIKVNEQARRVRLKNQLDSLRAVSDRKTQILARIADLLNRPLGAKWAETNLRTLKEALGIEVLTRLRDRARRGETIVSTDRAATEDERERHRLNNPNAKPLNFVSERLGEFIALDYLNHHPVGKLTQIKDKLHELSVLAPTTLSTAKRKEWVDWAQSLDRNLDNVENVLADALRFYCQTNFELMPALATTSKDHNRISSSLVWSPATMKLTIR